MGVICVHVRIVANTVTFFLLLLTSTEVVCNFNLSYYVFP